MAVAKVTLSYLRAGFVLRDLYPARRGSHEPARPHRCLSLSALFDRLPEASNREAFDYTPLLQIQRDIQGMPKGIERFRHYLRTIWNCYEADFELIPLMLANPMGKDHVTALLDELLALGGDEIAADAAAQASARLADIPGEFKAGVVVADDLKGGWTNRFDWEFTLRFGRGTTRPAAINRTRQSRIQPPKWSKFLWVYGASLEQRAPASQAAVREAMLTAAYRTAFVLRHGSAHTLRDMLLQEGHVMAMAGCTAPVLDEDDIAYIAREVLEPHLGRNSTSEAASNASSAIKRVKR